MGRVTGSSLATGASTGWAGLAAAREGLLATRRRAGLRPDRGVLLAMARRKVEKGRTEKEPWGDQGRGQNLPIRFPKIDDPGHSQVGLDGGIGAGKTGGTAAGGENPVPICGTNGINSHIELALGGAQDAQIHVAQPVDPVGANQGTGDLHDFHQALPPFTVPGTDLAAASVPDVSVPEARVPGAGAGAGAELPAKALAASGSQWSMMPTMVKSLG